MEPVRLTIYGQAVSKANSRELATVGPSDKRRMIFRKSDVALKFEADAVRQIPPAARLRLQGPIAIKLHMFYRDERPDMDESLVLDCLQDRWAKDKVNGKRILVQPGIFCNDRQVRWRLCIHHIDAKNPRVEVELKSIAPTADLFAADEFDLPLPF